MADLIGAGLRARGRAATQGRVSLAVAGGLHMAALLGLCLQAAFSVAMVTHRARDGSLFYLIDNGWSTTAHGVLAAFWVTALVLVVLGRRRLACVPAIMGGAGSVIVLLASIGGDLANIDPGNLGVKAVQFTLLGVVPAMALLLGTVGRRPPGGRRSPLWLGAFALLAGLFSVLDTGVRTSGFGDLSVGFSAGRWYSTRWFHAAGSLGSSLFWISLVGLVVLLALSLLDPRFGVAGVVAALPVAAYPIGMLVVAEPRPARLVVFGLAGLTATAGVALSSTLSLRRMQT